MQYEVYQRYKLSPRLLRHIETVPVVDRGSVLAWVCRGRKCICGSTDAGTATRTYTIVVAVMGAVHVYTGDVPLSIHFEPAALVPTDLSTSVFRYIDEHECGEYCDRAGATPSPYRAGRPVFYVGSAAIATGDGASATNDIVGGRQVHAVAEFNIYANSAAMSRRQRKLMTPSHRRRHIAWVNIDNVECLDITDCVPAGSRSPWSWLPETTGFTRLADDPTNYESHWRGRPYAYIGREVVLVEKRTCVRGRRRKRARNRGTIAVWNACERDVTVWKLRADCKLDQSGFVYMNELLAHVHVRYENGETKLLRDGEHRRWPLHHGYV